MKYKLCFVLVLAFCLSASTTFGQTFKRKPKTKTAAEKAEPAKQATVTKPVEALPEEEQNTNPDRITTHELKRKLDAKADVLILDNRTGTAWLGSSVKIKGAVHMPLQELMNSLDKLPKDKEIITYCTWRDEATSAGAAATLKDNGFRKVRALIGGFDKWEADGYPTEPKNQ